MSLKSLPEFGSTDWLKQFWRKDPSLWSNDPAEQDLIADRLGWLDAPAFTRSQMSNINLFVDEVRAASVHECVLLGMGGSSLAPEVLARCFGAQTDYPTLSILDTTHPDAIRAFTARLSLRNTLFIVSSKSGTTSETLSLYRHFYNAVDNNGAQFAAITDPGSPLQELAEANRFRRTFLNPADIGGRYAALSLVGMVPAAIAGIDINKVLRSAENEIRNCHTAGSSAYVLGQALADHARAGRDKLTLVLSPSISALGAWIEQLVAESTGKHGIGVVAIADEPLSNATNYEQDRLFVHVRNEADGEDADQVSALAGLERAGHPVLRRHLHDLTDLGAEFFAWAFATAVAGAALNINPFDEPDVNSAKQRTRDLLTHAPDTTLPVAYENETLIAYSTAGPEDELQNCLQQWLSQCREGDYMAILAYLPPECWSDLSALRAEIRQRQPCAVALALGPRYLHSSGQLHKGGANNGVFLVITDSAQQDLDIPQQAHTFGQLIQAQALGDMAVLLDRGRRVLHIHLRDRQQGLSALLAALR